VVEVGVVVINKSVLRGDVGVREGGEE